MIADRRPGGAALESAPRNEPIFSVFCALPDRKESFRLRPPALGDPRHRRRRKAPSVVATGTRAPAGGFKVMRIITIAIIVIVSQGCATMFNRTAQRRVLVTSTPPGAEVFIDGDPVGTTPTSVVVRDSAAEIRLESDGQSRQVRLSRRMSPWVWADLPAGALTGLLGAVAFRCDECDLNYVAGVFTSMAPLIVDLVTGRAMSLPSTISITLAPASSRRLDVRPRLPTLDGQPGSRSTPPFTNRTSFVYRSPGSSSSGGR